MEKLHFYLLFFFITSFAISQNDVDACKEWKEITASELNNKKVIEESNKYLSRVSDSCRLSIYLKLATIYRYQQTIDSAHYYYDKSIALAKEIHDEKSLIRTYTSKGYLLATDNKREASIDLLKKARVILKESPSDISWIYYYQTFAYLEDLNSDYLKAIKYTDSSITFAEKYNYDDEIDICYLNSGTYHMRVSNFEEAIKSTFKAAEIIEKRAEKNNLESAYYLLGILYSRKEQYESSITYLQKAIDRSQELNNDFMKMYCYDRMVVPYFKLNRIDDAILITDSVIAISLRLNNKIQLASGYNNKAEIFKRKKDFDKAEDLLNKAHNTLSTVKNSQKQLEFERINNLDGYISIYNNKKEYPKMLKYIKEYEEYTGPLDLLLYKKNKEKYYSEYYENVNDIEKALIHHKEWVKLKDSIFKKETQVEIADLEKKYDTKNKELEIISLNKEKQTQEIKTQEAETRQFIFLISTIIALCALFIGILVFLKIKRQQRELQKAHKEVTKLNKVKDHLFSILAHDLRGMILPFQRVGKIMKYHIDKENYSKAVELSSELERNSQNLSDVLNNLLSWSLEQMNNYKVNLTRISIADELQDITEGFKQHASYKNTDITIDCDTTEIIFDKGAFHLIFRNLIGNALKYTENGIVKITAINRDNDITFTVEDNGVGITPEKATKIFSLEKEQSAVGTKGEKGTGLGLNLVHRFVKLHQGNINVTSRKPNGTAFHLFFPDCAKSNM